MRKNESIFTGRIADIRPIDIYGIGMYLLTVTGESVAGRYDLIIRPKPDGEVPKKGDIFEANVILKEGYITQVKDYRTYPCPDNSEDPTIKGEVPEVEEVFFDLRGTVVKNTYDPDSNNTPQKFGYFDVQFSLDVVDGIVIPEDEKDANVTHCYFPLLSYPALGTKIALHIIPDAVTHNDKQTLVHGTIRSVLYDLSNLEGLQQVLINVTSINGNNIENERYMMTMLLPESINLQEDYEFQFAFEVIECPEPNEKDIAENSPVFFDLRGTVVKNDFADDSNVTTAIPGFFDVQVSADTVNGIVRPDKMRDDCYFPLPVYPKLGTAVTFRIIPNASALDTDKQTLVRGTISDVEDKYRDQGLIHVFINVDSIDGDNFELMNYTIAMLLPASFKLEEKDTFQFAFEVIEEPAAEEDTPVLQSKFPYTGWIGYTRDANITTIGDLTYNLVDVHVDQFNHLNVDQVYTFIVPTTDPVDLGDFIIFHVETLESREIQTPTISGMITQITPMENLPELSVFSIRLEQIDGYDVVGHTIELILPNNEDLREGDIINFRVSSAKCIEEFKKHDADEDAPECHDTGGDTAPLPTVKPKHGWRYWLGCRWLADLFK